MIEEEEAVHVVSVFHDCELRKIDVIILKGPENLLRSRDEVVLNLYSTNRRGIDRKPGML